MKNIIVIIGFSLAGQLSAQGSMEGTDSQLEVTVGDDFSVISEITDIPFDLVEGDNFKVFISKYNFFIGTISTSTKVLLAAVAATAPSLTVTLKPETSRAGRKPLMADQLLSIPADRVVGQAPSPGWLQPDL